MSVCMMLYKVRNDLTYKGSFYDRVKVNDSDFDADKNGVVKVYKLKKEMGAPIDETGKEDYEGALDEWNHKDEANAWSDGNKHEFIDFSYIKSIYKCLNAKAFKREARKLSKFSLKTFKSDVREFKYIPVEQVVYRQGWFFKHKYFKKKVTTNFFVTKKEMIKFFNKYLNTKDKRGYEAFNAFVNNWEDGMIFECSW